VSGLVSEHKRLVAVLRSPSHKDDLEEADEQEGELKEYEDAEREGKSKVMKSVIIVKSHVEGYTRSDGTYVKPHEDGRAGAQEQPGQEHKVTTDFVTRFGGLGTKAKEYLETVKKEKLQLALKALEGRTGKNDAKLHKMIERELDDRASSGRSEW